MIPTLLSHISSTTPLRKIVDLHPRTILRRYSLVYLIVAIGDKVSACLLFSKTITYTQIPSNFSLRCAITVRLLCSTTKMSFDGDSYHEFEQIDLTGPGASAHEYDHHGHSLLPSDWLDNIPGAEPQGTGNEMTMGDGGSFDPASGPPLDDSTSPGIHPPNSSQDHHPSSHGNEGEGYATAEDIADLSGSDESEPEPEPRWDQEHCMESCRPAWRAQQRKITKQKAKIRSLKSRIYRIHERDRKKINELRRRLRDAEARLEKQRKKPRTNTSPVC